MKHDETIPTCPICSNGLEQKQRGHIAVDYHCLNCGFSTDLDMPTVLREEAIINGEFDNEDV